MDQVISSNQRRLTEEMQHFDQIISETERSLVVLRGVADQSEELLLSFCRAHKEYDQVCLIDNRGWELIRVNNTDKGCQVVPQSFLQDKSSQYYVQGGMPLTPGDFFLSSFDLNVEQGKVEVPHKPMLRLVSFLNNGNILVINLLVGSFLDKLSANGVEMVNRGGYWLAGGKVEERFGWQTGKMNATLKNTNQDVWQQLQKKGEGSFVLGTEVTVFVSYRHPIKGELLGHFRLPFSEGEQVREWKFFIREDLANHSIYDLRTRFLFLFFVLSALYGMLSFILYSLLRKEQQANEARFKQEQRVRESESRFRRVFYNSPDSITISDMEGVFVEVNDGFCNLIGYEAEDVLGRRGVDVDLYVDEQLCHKAVDTLNKEDQLSNLEVEYVRKDGTVVPVLLSAVKVSMDGRPFIITISRDISSLKKVEEERRELEDKLRQSHKLEALGVLAGGIAHEFNNILAAIIGYTELASNDAPPDSQVKVDLQQILIGGNRAKVLVEQIRVFSHPQDVVKIPLSLPPLLKESVKMVSAGLPSSIRVNQYIDSDCCMVLADSTTIQQMLINLFSNAVHAMGDTGTLTVSLREVMPDQDFRSSHPELAEQHYLEIGVRDTGCGMDSATREQIFDPFFTTREVGKGTGMGLSVTYGIVREHDGIILVESEPDQGAFFRVLLPCCADEKCTCNNHQDGTLAPCTESILVVDDEKSLAIMHQRRLTNLGYQVTLVANGDEALEKFRAEPDAFNLILTDQQMPGLTGMELAEQIKEIRSGVPVILCTGFSEDLADEAAMQASGIDEVCHKPVGQEELSQKIRMVLDRVKKE